MMAGTPTRVLLVDDNPDDAMLIGEYLAESKGAQFHVQHADRLAVALERLDEGGIDVVLLDLSLPDSSGVETFHQVHNKAPSVPVVVLTGLDDESLGAELVRQGGQDYLVKGDVDSRGLTRCINYAIERKQAEEVLEHRNQELTVLFNVASILVQPGTFEERVVRVLEELLPIAQADRALFLVGDEEEEGLTVVAQVGPAVPGAPTASVSYESASGVAFQEGQPIVVNNYAEHPLAVDAGIARGVKSGVFLPVKSSEGVIGVLDIISLEADHFTPERVNALTAIGGGLGMLLENARLYDLLEHHADELARSNADLEQFAYVASHDLQEPLRMVTMYMQILEEEYGGQLSADADRYIKYAVDGATRMGDLIDGLLGLSRVNTQKIQPAPTDCNELVGQVISDLGQVIEDSGAEVTFEDLPIVNADSTQLGQLFQNLISNGIKFRGDALPRVHVEAQERGGEWVFSVRDNGIGIAPRHRERVFQMFQRLHNRSEYPGTGIGLAICYKIVQSHGGRIWVESVAGEGSTFYFTVPAA